MIIQPTIFQSRAQILSQFSTVGHKLNSKILARKTGKHSNLMTKNCPRKICPKLVKIFQHQRYPKWTYSQQYFKVGHKSQHKILIRKREKHSNLKTKNYPNKIYPKSVKILTNPKGRKPNSHSDNNCHKSIDTIQKPK